MMMLSAVADWCYLAVSDSDTIVAAVQMPGWTCEWEYSQDEMRALQQYRYKQILEMRRERY